MKKYEVLANYAYNRRVYLEQDIKQLQENLRYRQISQVDCLELIIADERLTMFTEVMRDVKNILSLRDKLPATDDISSTLRNKDK